MPKVMTKEDVKRIQFYQIPKVFFGDTKYGVMRNESKLAYMLLQDLLPLSIQNNWVNEEGGVFVKLSRAKLMSLLNIKGTQKIAQVMKELVDYGLIIYKRIGLTKCNEIYICLPDIGEPVDKNKPSKLVDTQKCEDKTSDGSEMPLAKIPESNIREYETQTHINTNSIKTNYNKTNINLSIHQKGNMEEIEELSKHFSNQLHTDYLTQRYDEGWLRRLLIIFVAKPLLFMGNLCQEPLYVAFLVNFRCIMLSM